MGYPDKVTAPHSRSAPCTASPHGPPQGLAPFLLTLIAVLLPVVGWGGSDSPGQLPADTSRSATQAAVSGPPKNGPPESTSSTPPAEDITQTEGNADRALSERYDLALGKSVFNHACLTCHGNSVRDAPRVGDMSAWQPRLAQGLDVLIQHALEGHGRMPAKGGDFNLTDREVMSAVAYIYQMGTEILAQPRNPITHSGCDAASNPGQCSPEQTRRLLILQLLWLLSGPHQETPVIRESFPRGHIDRSIWI
jgi:cytochrome c5